MNVTPQLLRKPLAMIAVAAIAASTALLPASAEPKRGGTLTAVVNPEPAFLVSAHNPVGGVLQVSSKMFEGLLTYDLEMNLQPALAESWDVADDGLSVTFHLREGVTWHDGEPFTSEDVKFTTMKIWKELHPRNRVNMAKVTDVETPDAHTAVFRLSEPVPFLLSVMNGGESQVVPKHIYDGEDVGKNLVEKDPVGTGPFKLKEWRRGEAVILERYDGYWQEGKPYLDGVIFRIIPDEAARATAFETGEVQYGGFTPVSPCTAQRLGTLENIGVETRGYEFFGTIFMFELNLRDEVLKDKKVRHALAHAIDRDFILENVWCGFGTPTTGPVPPQLTEFYTDDVPTYEYDPAKAEALLDEAGYPRGEDGIRFKMVHDPLPFGPNFVRSAEVVKQNLAEVGIELEIRTQDTPTYLRRIYTDYDFDMSSTTLSALPDPTLGVQRLYWSKNIVEGVPFSNSSGYSNPEMDRILEAAQTENDKGKRVELFHQMQKLAQEDLPIIDLFVMSQATIFDKRLKNHTTQSDGYPTFADAYLESE
ncbi:MAG: ABC transporter substrate-binding protein [Rhizobiales bacterium]|nr:ABC transporter substrate-binding protein [Hyphomicrobiales bacterium]MBA68427.1 ABC transporter substrate-binding protein [Hyphomicrobiales bacterium]|tara:strand:+ start:2702 stop:4306 length:1605 start_codon:yes stop_codon:yes gene_type:complete